MYLMISHFFAEIVYTVCIYNLQTNVDFYFHVI